MLSTERAHSVVRRVERVLPEIYVTIAVFVLGSQALLTPPFYIPDEVAHVEREIQLSRGHLLPEKLPTGAGGVVDTNVVMVANAMIGLREEIETRYPITTTRPDRRMPVSSFSHLRSLRWSGRDVEADFQNTAVYPPGCYLPMMLGWTIGRAENMSILHSLLLARVLAASSAILLGWLALRLAGRARWIAFLYLLLPTGLNLSASCSQDAPLFAVSGLVFVMLWRAAQDRLTFRAVELMAVTPLLLVLCSARAPYLALVVVLAAVALETGAPRKTMVRVLFCASTVIAGVMLWQIWMKPFGIMHVPGMDPAAQIHFMKMHPFGSVLRITIGTLRSMPNLFLKALEVMGYNDVYPSWWIYGVLACSLPLAWWSAPRVGMASARARQVMGVGLLLAVAGISVAQYILGNPTGAYTDFGVQSRYYLPLLPFALLLWPLKSTKSSHDITGEREASMRDWVLLTAMSAFVGVVLYMPWLASQRYYGEGLYAALRGAM